MEVVATKKVTKNTLFFSFSLFSLSLLSHSLSMYILCAMCIRTSCFYILATFPLFSMDWTTSSPSSYTSLLLFYMLSNSSSLSVGDVCMCMCFLYANHLFQYVYVCVCFLYAQQLFHELLILLLNKTTLHMHKKIHWKIRYRQIRKVDGSKNRYIRR